MLNKVILILVVVFCVNTLINITQAAIAKKIELVNNVKMKENE